MIELIKTSNTGAVELDKHATQIITTKYVDGQIDKVEADIAALDKKTAQRDTSLNNIINDIKSQVFENTEDMAEQLEDIGNALFDEILPRYDEAIEKNSIAIAETQESVDAFSEEVAADIVSLETEIAEINNSLSTIGEKPWERVVDMVILEADVGSHRQDFPKKTYKEIYIEAVLNIVAPEQTTAKNTRFNITRHGNAITAAFVNVKDGDTLYLRAKGWISPTKHQIYDMWASTNRYAYGYTYRNSSDVSSLEFEYMDHIIISSGLAAVSFGAGSAIDIWGR